MIEVDENIKTHKIDKSCVPLEIFKNYYLTHNYNENMFKSDGSINPNYNSSKKTGIIAQIFENHWEDYYIKNRNVVDRYRPNAPSEIKKIIDCKNKDLGCTAYECPNCHDVIFIGNTCKSRLCTSCGYKYKNERVENILQHAINCKHRQIVFTIPKEMRIYFFDFKNMDFLFKAVNIVLDSIIHVKFKKNKKGILKLYKINLFFKLGFYAFLHTFGRDLKWNPHIHVLIAEKIFNKITSQEKNLNYFDYDALSKRFQKVLLDLMKNIIPKHVVRQLYNNHKKGFYVYAEPKNFKSLKDGVEYVARYCGRPAISENRIISYDGNNVTFWYNAHEDESYHEVTITAFDFISLILRHIIPREFKTIRSYGFYRKKLPFHDKINLLVKQQVRKFRNQLLKHELSIMKSFNHSPYDCPNCKTHMNFLCVVT